MSAFDISPLTHRLLVAYFLTGVGKATLWKLAASADFARADDKTVGEIFPELREFSENSPKIDLARRRADDQIIRARASEISIFGFWDKEYPATLRNSAVSPAIFWYRGDSKSLTLPQVAVIGTREPTKAGGETTRRISSNLANHGFSVVSGLARGIDTLAHVAALESKGSTIAILPGGMDNIAPKSNHGLAERIASEGGGLLTEFPIGMPPLPVNFVTRDATQAAISLGVVLVQSDKRGGSLHASRAITKLRRTLIVPAPVAIDVANAEPKIFANNLFSQGKFEEAESQMGFSRGVSANTYILRGREQYPELHKILRTSWTKLTSPTREAAKAT